MPASGTAPAPHMHASEEIKKHVSIPIATVSRINEPWVADELIANGKTDICMIGRPNLCDSEFANKAMYWLWKMSYRNHVWKTNQLYSESSCRKRRN